MLLQQNAKNIFLENSLYIDGNQIKLVNPFCVNDTCLISRNESFNNTVSSNNEIKRNLQKYYQNILVGKDLDFVLFGSLVELLFINRNCSKEDFNEFELNYESNYQNNLILTWLNSVHDNEKLASVIKFIDTFSRDTKYVFNDYNLEIEKLKWLAFKLPVNEILQRVISSEELEIVFKASDDTIEKSIKKRRDGIVYKNSKNELINKDDIVVSDDTIEGACL